MDDKNSQSINTEAPNVSPTSTPIPTVPHKRSKLIYVFFIMLLILILTVGASVAINIFKSFKKSAPIIQTSPTQNSNFNQPTKELSPEGNFSKEGESCGVNAGAAGDTQCKSNLTCVYKDSDAIQNKTGVCAKK